MTGQPDEYRTIRFVGVGCVTAIAGLFSGGMMGVLVAKVVGGVRRCEAPTGLPACDWHVYAGIGMLIGLITLPVLALNRLRRSEQATGERD